LSTCRRHLTQTVSLGSCNDTEFESEVP